MDDTPLLWLEPVPPQATSPTPAPERGPGLLTLHTPRHDELLRLKGEIEAVHPAGIWDDAKKITNPYEYVFLSLQKRMHRSIAAVQPLSRSYFKMMELWNLLDLRDIQRTSHTAEGPGGFLEAIQHRAPGTRSIAMTLRSTERSVPGWRKSQAFLRDHPAVTVTYGSDNTGNLYSLANQTAYQTAARSHLTLPADLYTADGGFDFSSDYNGQENTVQRLLAAEALAGLSTLRAGGTMILKVFDTKNRATLELLWTLSNCFERTALVKPHTSRPANSERYWIGQGCHAVIPPWIPAFLRTLTATEAPHGWNRLFADPSPAFHATGWLTGVQAFQERVETMQTMNIQLTLNVLRNPARPLVLDLLRVNVHMSRRWCAANGITENSQTMSLTDDQVALQNLEEALGPFLGGVARRSSPTPSPQTPTHHGSSSARLPPPPAAPAWRSALPESILSRRPCRTVSDTPPSGARSPHPSPTLPAAAPQPAPPGPVSLAGAPPQTAVPPE
jgi:23S rRNA U2552 (ribose-2'-O)-methylase RlmE/FtsJ